MNEMVYYMVDGILYGIQENIIYPWGVLRRAEREREKKQLAKGSALAGTPAECAAALALPQCS